MLTVVKNAKGIGYLPDYDGKYGPATKAAITAFQTDQSLIAKPGAAKADAGVLEKAGFVDKRSTTLAKLVAALPADYKDLMIIENTSTVYLPGSEADAKASAASINATVNLEPAFRGKVAQLVNLMYSTHKIVLSLTGSGGYRDFQKQYQIQLQSAGATHAGPGESNHNFGRGVDIGFNNFQWIKAGGQKAVDDWWLNVLTKKEKDAVVNKKALQLWMARDAIGVKGAPGLFNSILDGDTDHLQSFDDHLPNDRALADLLNRVGKLKWEAEHKIPRRYNSDLGLGGKMFNVGSAKDIWTLSATVTKAMIAQAKNDIALNAAKLKGPAAVKAFVPLKEADIKADDIVNVRKALKADFVTAEAKWLDWKAIP